MRTNVDIDDELLAEAMRKSGGQSREATIEEGLKMLIRVKSQASILALRGKVEFFSNLEELRLDRLPAAEGQ